MQSSIRARLTVILTCLLLGSALLQGLLLSTQISSRFLRATRTQLLAQARQVALALSSQATDQGQLLEQLAAAGEVRITLFDPAGEVLQDSDLAADDPALSQAQARPEVINALSQGEGWNVRQSEATQQNTIYVAVLADLPDGGTVVRLALPLVQVQEASATHWLTVGSSFLLVAFLAIWVAIWLARDLTRPIEQMTQAAQRIAAGDLSQHVVVNRQDELGILVDSFNRLADTNQQRYQEIVASKAQFETVIQNTVSGIFLLDAKGTVFLSNPRAGQVLGFDPVEDVPDHFSRLTTDPNLCLALNEALSGQQPYEKTVTISIPAQRVIELHVVPIAASERSVAVFYDISEASRLASIRADLVANVSHELKTPVTSIHGFAETILDEGLVSDPNGRRFVEIIYRESWRLMRLVNDLLDLSYLELDPNAIETQPVDLVEILKDVVERDAQQAADKQIELKLVIGVQSAITLGDQYRLSQAVDNLIGNAIKYTAPGGEIRVNLQYEKNGFQIAVRDTGVGIEPEHLGRIFERFYRTDKARSRQHGGTGLGLSIVKHIVELHGGQVWVESKVGVGSVFYVQLPARQEKVAKTHN